MKEAIKTEEYKGKKIAIVYDDSPANPREWDNLSQMVCFHNRYTIGDKHDYNFESWGKLKEEITEREKPFVIMPLYLFDHSGVKLQTYKMCQWDSSFVGYAFVTEESAKKEYGELTNETEEMARKVLQGEIDTYSNYLEGNVYGYIVYREETCNLGQLHEITEDSCFGYYSIEEVISAAKEAI